MSYADIQHSASYGTVLVVDDAKQILEYKTGEIVWDALRGEDV